MFSITYLLLELAASLTQSFFCASYFIHVLLALSYWVNIHIVLFAGNLITLDHLISITIYRPFVITISSLLSSKYFNLYFGLHLPHNFSQPSQYSHHMHISPFYMKVHNFHFVIYGHLAHLVQCTPLLHFHCVLWFSSSLWQCLYSLYFCFILDIIIFSIKSKSNESCNEIFVDPLSSSFLFFFYMEFTNPWRMWIQWIWLYFDKSTHREALSKNSKTVIRELS